MGIQCSLCKLEFKKHQWSTINHIGSKALHIYLPSKGRRPEKSCCSFGFCPNEGGEGPYIGIELLWIEKGKEMPKIKTLYNTFPLYFNIYFFFQRHLQPQFFAALGRNWAPQERRFEANIPRCKCSANWAEMNSRLVAASYSQLSSAQIE